MKREINIEDISESNLYDDNDMVRIGCNDCEGCSECCRFASDTIILDPSDIFRLEKCLNTGFEGICGRYAGLRMVDGITLPHLLIDENKGCLFLNDEGRCSIHEWRPGNCRLFPLARIYENGDFRYFIQKNECVSPLRVKVKISKWLGIDRLQDYRRFLNEWHNILKSTGEKLATLGTEEQKTLILKLLQIFYVSPYDTGDDFYRQFDERVNLFLSTVD